MTRRLQTVVYDCDPDYLVERLYGAPAVAAGVDREPVVSEQLSRRISRANRYRLRPLRQGGAYERNVAQVVTQAARGGAAVREWAAIELFYDEATGTTVRARLHDGAGTSYHWTAGAWAVAGATDWNTPAEVVANFASLPITGATGTREVGVEWQIQTSVKTATPYVYGALIAARLLMMARSGTTAAGTGSDAWADDAIHRVLLPWLSANVVPELTDERDAEESVKVIDYSDGLGDGQPDYSVTGVQAVYNLDSDAEMLTPLAGTWDGAFKHYTLGTALPRGTRYAVRLTHELLCAHAADWDLYQGHHPHLIVDTYGPVVRRSGLDTVAVRNIAAGTALRIPEHSVTDYSIAMLLQAQDHVEQMSIEDAIRRALSGKLGLVLVSPNTGLPYSLHGFKDANPSRALGGAVYGSRFALRMLTREYHGDEEQAYLLDEDGLDLTVGGDATVVTAY
jgi:hypothetical protein